MTPFEREGEEAVIRVLIVDDSLLMQKILGHILRSDPEIRIAGFARSGEDALAFLAKESVDVVTMDINMGGMNGFETTRRIMESDLPVPVVVVSSCWDPIEVEKTFQAMEAGAVAILPKPANFASCAEDYAMELLGTVRAATQSKVTRLRKKMPEKPFPKVAMVRKRKIMIAAAGASTGGPQALSDFLSRLPVDFPCPLLIVQHMAPGFTQGLVEWLDRVTPMTVRMATEGIVPCGGTVYVAPEEVHMTMRREGTIHLTTDPPEHMVRPSVSRLFRSIASTYGKNAAVLLFSGMGADGAEEMKHLKDLGAATFAQSKETSVVWGMPGEAVHLNAADYVEAPPVLASLLMEISDAEFQSAPGDGRGRTPNKLEAHPCKAEMEGREI